ncbi:hypothetical protein CC80DRAFT_490628 [Byssothecium circinans]|uniref:Uncharacterized protein n=1 Tax=Byssothecium circinans TaxID=147558 RepID=A0A6A5U4Q9_9PLEO|nr:hypothetical protein CC80DRAFT_490628 [Byssothecium circinans]
MRARARRASPSHPHLHPPFPPPSNLPGPSPRIPILRHNHTLPLQKVNNTTPTNDSHHPASTYKIDIQSQSESYMQFIQRLPYQYF